MKFSKITISDYIGIASASLCVVHCVITPFLILFFTNTVWWEKFSYFFLLLSFISAFQATEHSKNRKILSLIWCSFALLAIGIIFEDDFPKLEIISYLASLCLIIGHILNIRYCKKC
jgi:hypothetical protein